MIDTLQNTAPSDSANEMLEQLVTMIHAYDPTIDFATVLLSEDEDDWLMIFASDAGGAEYIVARNDEWVSERQLLVAEEDYYSGDIAQCRLAEVEFTTDSVSIVAW